MSAASTTEDPGPSEFRALYRSHYGFVWHTLHLCGIESAAIEDALQDVFVVAYRRRDTFAGSSTKAWLYGIARRVASNYRRGQRRRTERRRAIGSVRPRNENVGAREAIQALDRYLAELEESDRELFVLSELEGMTGPELAAMRGRNVQTIYSRIQKLRKEFRSRLVDLDEVRRDRPRATNASWVAMLPLFDKPAVAGATWLGGLGSGWLAATLATGVAVAGLVALDHALPSTVEPNLAAADLVATAAPEPREKVATRRRNIAAAPEESPTEPPVVPQPEPQVVTPVVPEAAGAARKPRSGGTITATEPRPGLADETTLIREADAAVRRGDWSRALTLTDRHAARFAQSPLADLRATVRIVALCGKGKTAQAKGEARIARQAHPASASLARIEKTCAGAS